ncbi:MAG TPA: 2-succinyl-5-enolpyruvyl-6-hydroxy-3-cyclohexene-1-carboxylic-acid synthase, partial [Longimicrobiales bacterium]|nr:2-succinyl-5-enolpyruvyl-6-hydroxy-3-cyclohexene-1-carboxylic-acid synthase [Longimicrobiales bacterium]
MTPANLLTEWGRLLIGSLARAGVTEAIISPGSRSTPFTWAALRESRLRCRTIIDERAAAFFAVGQAKITGSPSLLICTSGSAAANYLPAIVEADRSGTPLIVLTADRPFELQHGDAPQTIDQVKLYGDAVRRFFEIGMPDASDGALIGLRRIAAHAAALARGPVPGPVHLNARARIPLDPVVVAESDDARALVSLIDALLAEPVTRADPGTVVSWQSIEAIARAARGARRGVIVCGPMSPHHAPSRSTVAALARRTGFPVLVEATSQQRFGTGDRDPDPDAADSGSDSGCDALVRIHAFDALLRSPAMRARFRPDFVLRIGAPPTSTAWSELVEGSRHEEDPALRIREHVVTPVAWSDPHGTAATMAIGRVESTLELIDLRVHEWAEEGDDPVDDDARRARTEWRDLLAAADAAAIAALDVSRAGGDDEGVMVRALIDAMPDGALLALGNSLPVREADTFAAGDARDLLVWSQRGANGIDGLIAGAAGAAAAAERPAALLLGDVSALHDAG